MAVTDFGKKYAGSFQKRKDEGQLRRNEQREVTVVDDTLKRRVAQSVESGARAKTTFDRAQQQREFERNLGAFEAQRNYNLGRINSLMEQDRERRKKAQAEAAAQQAIQQETTAEPAMPSFKRQNLTGNSRFTQAEATGAYNPYEDALAAMKQRIAEQRAQEWPVLPEPGNLPKLTADNQLLGGNFSLEDFNPPQMPNLAIEKQLKEAEEAAAQRFDAGEWADANAKAGWTQIGGRIMQGINAAFEPAQALGADLGAKIAANVFGGPYATYADELAEQVKEKPALGALYDWAVDPMEKATAYADEINKEGGYLAEIGGSVIQNAVAQIPNAITALMSGGASTALDAFNRAQTTFGGAVLNEAKKMATNPNFLMSFGQMYGGRYEDAVEGGANPYVAALTSTITTLMNSIVEMGGGIENLPFTRATVGDWVKNALDEGKEEVIQQVIDQMGQKAMVDSSIPWYSTEDQNAVINPKVLGENALLGALAGGVIGGPGMVVNNAMNIGTQEQRETFEGAPEISDIAMELIQDENREKLEPIREENKGQKYAQMSAEDIWLAQESAQQTDNYGDPIARLAQETADAEMADERREAVSVQTAPVSRETISREVPAAPVRAEAAVSQDAPTAQRSMPETQVEQAARRIENEASKRQFVQAAEKYGEAALVFASNYEGGDIATYDRAFNHLYSAGQTNLPLNRIREATDALTAGMSEGAKQAIWQAGRNVDVRTIRPGVQQRTTVRLNDRQKRQFKMLDEMAKRYNYEIDIVDSIAGGMANGAYAGGRRIVVAADAAEEAIVQTGVHELVHALKANDAAGYGVLQDVVLKHLEGSENWLGIDYAVDTRIQEYAAGGVTLTREGAIEEIVAEAVPTFLTDEAAVKAFVRENRTLAEKVRDFFVKFAKEIREIAERYMLREGMDRDEIANLLGRSDALTEIAQTFDRAMEAAGEKEAAASGETVFARKKKEINGADDVSEWTADSRFLGAVLNKAERKLFRDTVNNMHNLKIEQASNGEYIVEAGRCLVYTDGNAENPKVFRVVKFNTDDGTELSFMVDYYKKAEKGGMVFDEIRVLLEGMFDKGIALEYTNAVHLPVWRKKRTGKGKARYSLGEGNRGEVSAEREGKFSLNKPVEQVGDLVAVHNVDPEGLARSLNLGGVPAPSIAVVKSSSGHSKFGTVSLVFHKDSIDPEADARNRVYGYDAWTPDKHNARIEYEVNEEAKKRIDAALREYTAEIPALYRNSVMNFVSELDRKINNDYGFDGLIEDAAGNYGFMAAYLASAGDQVEMERTTRTEGGISEEARAKLEAVAAIFDHNDEYISKTPMSKIVEEYGDQIAEAMPGPFAWTKERYMRVLQRVSKYLRGELDGRTVEVDDVEATNRKIDAAINEEDFEKWLRELFDGVQGRAGIAREVDPYDRRGNRKSFAQTHYEVTAENIVRALYENAERKGANFKGASAEGIAAVASKEYKNINAIRKDKGRLYTEDAEAHDARYQKLDDELNAIMDDVRSVNPNADLDAAATAIMNAAQDGSRTATAIVRSFKKNGLTIDKGIGERIAAMYKEASEFPTGYFEAKPERVVGFDEVRAAIVPDSMDESILKQLNAAVENVIAYPDGDETARLNALNGLEGVRFSLNNTAPIESVMADDQNLMLPADVDVREESIKGVAASALSRGISERMDQQITGVANKILKETGSTYAKADIIANMKSLIDEYAANGATEETLRAVAEMAKKIIESSSRADNTLREQYADLRKKLRETGISLTETQKQEAANEAGSYNAYRQSLMGTVKLTNDGISLDSIWGELSSQNPEIFPADTGEAEMVGKLTDFMMLMKPKYENPYGMDMDGAALEMAMRIQADLMGILGARDAAKAMYGTAEKFRKQYEAEFKVKLAQQKKERVEKFQKIASELKAAKAKGDSAEQAKIMNRYRAALKATALDEAYAEVRATYKEREAQKAENRKANELRGRVAKQAGELMKMFARPEKGKRIPTGLQGLVLDALGMLDINGEHAAAAGKETKKAAEFRDKLGGIRSFYEQVINSQSKGEAPEGMDGLMMAFTERNMAAMNEALDILGGGDKFRLRDMNSEQLKMLDELLKNIRHTVDSVGKLWKIHRYQSVVELGNASIAEMNERGQQKIDAGSTAGKARDFLALDMLEPVSYGERLGEGGSVIIQGLMDGEKIKFGKIRDAAEATGKMLKDTKVTGYDIGKWRRNVRTVKLGSGKVVKMSDVNIMELYLTAKRPQGLQHLLANGMKIQSKEAGQQPRHIELTQADITDISGMLSEKQKKIADLMQAYLSGEAAKWGNDVTQRLYLYDAFTEQTYWPISSDPNSLKTQEPEADRAFTAITNAGFTKPLNVKATNPIIIGDAFETFGRHIGEMASYAGYAEVMTDTLAWINYRQRSDDGRLSGSVKESIETLLGNGGIKYLTKLVQDINGARRGGDGMQIANALLRNYKANAVIGKIRVAIQQPTSIVRAAAEINPAYLLTGLKASKGAVQEMQKWSNLAWWKSNGNYDIGVGKSTDEIFWGDTKRSDTVMEKIGTSGGLIDPGKMDDWAWARMWSAVKSEISRTRPELKQGSDEYFKAVADRFEYIVDRTLVVDTVMHRSDMMRSKDGLTQMLTSFKAEPTKSYNMLMRAIMEVGRNPKSKAAKLKLARTTGAFAASAAATAAATALFDAFKNRDDEDDLWTYLTEGGFWTDWTKAFLNGFAGNINIAGSIPLVGEALEALQGEDVTLMQFESLTNSLNAVTTFRDHFFGENKKKTTVWGAVKPMLTAVSQATGLPVSGLIANSEMLVRIYDPKLMQAKSEMTSQDEAYKVLYEAIAKGDSKKAASVRAQLTKGLYGAAPKSPKEIDRGIAYALAENDERVMRAYQMREAGNQAQALLKLKKQIMADGFTDAQVTAAINYCETLLNTEETEKDMTEQLTAKMFDKNHLYSAIRNGSIEDVAAIAEYLENVSSAKDPAKSIMSDVSGEFRQEYLELIGSGKTAQAAALAKKLAVVGIDEETIAGWVKDGRYDSMKEAVAAGDAKEAGRIVRQLTESGATASGIVSSLNSRFREQYVEYMRSGKQAQAKRLMEVLQGLGLYWKDGKTNYYRDEVFEEWLEDSE